VSLDMSLCILTHNHVPETLALIASVRRFANIKIEICIADQQSTPANSRIFKETADKFSEVSDREIWDLGIASSKNKAINCATNDWIIIGDPGEVWHENFEEWPGGLVESIQKHQQNIPVFRVLRGDPEIIRGIVSGEISRHKVKDSNARVFMRSVMQLIGYTHDAPMCRQTGELWSHWARKRPCVAWVEHTPDRDDDPVYVQRKNTLYWHLLHKIVEEPNLRIGTDPYWYTTYWDSIKSTFKNVSFEDWQRMGG
jgi:hypothetical protein